jgi:hypothetical protein
VLDAPFACLLNVGKLHTNRILTFAGWTLFTPQANPVPDCTASPDYSPPNTTSNREWGNERDLPALAPRATGHPAVDGLQIVIAASLRRGRASMGLDGIGN